MNLKGLPNEFFFDKHITFVLVLAEYFLFIRQNDDLEILMFNEGVDITENVSNRHRTTFEVIED